MKIIFLFAWWDILVSGSCFFCNSSFRTRVTGRCCSSAPIPIVITDFFTRFAFLRFQNEGNGTLNDLLLLKSTPPHVDAIPPNTQSMVYLPDHLVKFMVNVGIPKYTYTPLRAWEKKKSLETINFNKDFFDGMDPSKLIPASHPPLVQPQASSIVDQGQPETSAWRGWSEVSPQTCEHLGESGDLFVLRMNV